MYFKEQSVIMKLKIKVNINGIASICWAASIFSYMFQCYWRGLAKLIVPLLIVFLMLEITRIKFPFQKEWIKLFMVYIIYLSISFAISCFNGTSINVALRFYLILCAIPLALCIKEPRFEIEWRILKVISVIKSMTILLTWLDVFITQDYMEYRSWALESGVGDIYILHGIPFIQLLGTSIFVMLFICDFLKNGRFTMYGLLMIITAVAAGNSAYILGIFVFITLYYLRKFKDWILDKNWRAFIAIPIALIVIFQFGRYAVDSLNSKKEYSNAVRLEQVHVLMDTNFIIGNGLGDSVNKTGNFRNYNGDTYFELQTLYIYYQIGILGLFFFYILTLIPYTGKNNRWKLIAYISYLIYTFFNPYCFDSTHIFSVLLISNCIPEQHYIESKEEARNK